MNNYYTSTISPTLAERLKEKGMPIETEGDNIWCPPYAEVFDWLMERDIIVTIRAVYYRNRELRGWQPHYNHWGLKKCPTWHEAANAAIEKALTLI